MKKNKRRTFLKKLGIGFLSFSIWDYKALVSWIKENILGYEPGEEVFFTTGFKVSEVSQHTAVIWTRLCGQKSPNPIRHQRRKKIFRHPIDFDEDQSVKLMDGGVQGAKGFVRARVFNKKEERVSEWVKVKSDNDYTMQIPFNNLKEGERYHVKIEGKSEMSEKINCTKGTFTTPPNSEHAASVHLVTSTCQYLWSYDDKKRGFKTYDSMGELQPDFFIQTGDYVYYDKPGPLATTLRKARHKWHAMDSRPSIRDFFKEVPIYMIKDDHDLLKNDVFRSSGAYGNLSFEEGLKLWYENVPIQGKPYRTIRWGKDLQIWLMEGREYRSPNTRKDSKEKTIWGEEQIRWFKKTVASSNATFKILFSPTPVVGPDRKNKRDNHANAGFSSEGEWLREYLSRQKGMFVVCGDRHWQYVSEDAETGLIEFGSGPVSDYHAQGWDPNDVRPEHKFLRVKGGFLSIQIDRRKSTPFILFRHCNVNGNVVNEEYFT